MHSAAKDRIPNAVITRSFKKYFHEALNERQHNEESSLFYFLPSISDRKEKIKEKRDNVNLNPIDCSFDYLNSFSTSDKEVAFRPGLFDFANVELRIPQVELFYEFFRQMAETKNVNIVRNADFLLAMSNKDNGDIVCVGPTKQTIWHY